ncbi:hypothetical protein [Chitinophaga tropicalis]|uniref:Uncharacterized protein n=1 Tax=Chitinophaga tropicalis TaxID=2683588 RepID=A0A7K1UAP5_9BACT|nr:hypothetical protein [Chitinophaga tropicalis]MVT11348.1 hypothetical protein [Chitinophaga tropicalis]
MTTLFASRPITKHSMDTAGTRTMAYAVSKEQHSNFHHGGKPIIYCRTGEPVDLIAEHGDIWIVESTAGIRFPVNKKFVIHLKNSNSNG